MFLEAKLSENSRNYIPYKGNMPSNTTQMPSRVDPNCISTRINLSVQMLQRVTLPLQCQTPRLVLIHPNVRCYMRFPVPFISIFCILLSCFTIFTRLLAIKLFSLAQHLSRVCVGNSVINTGRKEGDTGPHKDLMTTEAQNLEKPRDYILTLPLPTILAKLTSHSQSSL